MKSKRTKATGISKEVRGTVIRRDTPGSTLPRCIFCGSVYGITIAHYVSRASGGLGIEQNLACVCMECHRKLDQSTQRKEMLEIFKRHLQRHYEDWNENDLKYRKGELKWVKD